MGVIRWEEQYPGRWHGYLGKLGIADVIDFGSVVVWTLPDTLRNPDSEEFMGGTSAASIEAAKGSVEGFVAKWMADTGLFTRYDLAPISDVIDAFLLVRSTPGFDQYCSLQSVKEKVWYELAFQNGGGV